MTSVISLPTPQTRIILLIRGLEQPGVEDHYSRNYPQRRWLMRTIDQIECGVKADVYALPTGWKDVAAERHVSLVYLCKPSRA